VPPIPCQLYPWCTPHRVLTGTSLFFLQTYSPFLRCHYSAMGSRPNPRSPNQHPPTGLDHVGHFGRDPGELLSASGGSAPSAGELLLITPARGCPSPPLPSSPPLLFTTLKCVSWRGHLCPPYALLMPSLCPPYALLVPSLCDTNPCRVLGVTLQAPPQPTPQAPPQPTHKHTCSSVLGVGSPREDLGPVDSPAPPTEPGSMPSKSAKGVRPPPPPAPELRSAGLSGRPTDPAAPRPPPPPAPTPDCVLVSSAGPCVSSFSSVPLTSAKTGRAGEWGVGSEEKGRGRATNSADATNPPYANNPW
jgi:hypothetical protein